MVVLNQSRGILQAVVFALRLCECALLLDDNVFSSGSAIRFHATRNECIKNVGKCYYLGIPGTERDLERSQRIVLSNSLLYASTDSVLKSLPEYL